MATQCDVCVARQEHGQAPVCAETGIGGALRFGALDELAQQAPGRRLHRTQEGVPDPDVTRPAIRLLTSEPDERPA